jgi:hypothetical protein
LTNPSAPSAALIITTPISVSVWSYATAGGYIGDVYASMTGKGNVVSGYKFVAEKNAGVDTNGYPPDYLPGTLPGYTTSGGQYT